MARFADKYGVEVIVEGVIEGNKRVSDRLREMIMAVLHRKGMSLRFIGEVMNTDHTVVMDVLEGMPDEVKDFYAKFRLEGLLEVTRKSRAAPRPPVSDRRVFPVKPVRP
jgi:hypothetical protein